MVKGVENSNVVLLWKVSSDTRLELSTKHFIFSRLSIQRFVFCGKNEQVDSSVLEIFTMLSNK